MARRSYSTLILTMALVLMLACAVPTLGPAPTPIPTFDPNSPLTAIAGTAGAAATQTAFHAPTATPSETPTKTPTVAPTFTPTFLFIVFTNTVPPTVAEIGSSGKDYDCQVMSVDPVDNSNFSPDAIFNVRWTVANIGKKTWDQNNMDYRYADGKRIFRQSAYDFPDTVAPGELVDLTAEMQAPAEPGTYTTTWTINMGNNWFCSMNLTINVQ